MPHVKNLTERDFTLGCLWDTLVSMTRGILIAGNNSSLFSAAAAEAAKRVESFVSVQIPNHFPMPEGGTVLPPQAETAKGAVPLSWNPASPISARTLVLTAENRLGKINNAVLVCSPPAVFKTADALTPQDIDILVNDEVKGWFLLVRELVLYFRRLGAGSLSFVAPEISSGGGAKNTPVDLLGPAASASFQAFAQSILASTTNEPFQVMGFTGFEAGSEGEFISWLFKVIDEGSGKNSGRWHRYAKLRLFR